MTSSEFGQPIPADEYQLDRTGLENRGTPSGDPMELLAGNEDGGFLDLSLAIEEVTDPSDFARIADAYGLPQTTGNRLSMGHFAGRMIERAAILAEDPMDGSASPDEIA